MGNVIFSNNFVTVADAAITARSQAAGYAKINVMDRWNPKRRFRANDKTTNDFLINIDGGATQTLAGIFLNKVNFSKVRIQGHATDDWGSPTYPGTDLTVTPNKTTGYGHVYIPLTGFDYQWKRIFIPTGATGIGPYTTKWEIGTLCMLSAVTELAHNISYGSGQTGTHFYKRAVNERIKTGEDIRWEGSLVFGNRPTDHEAELWTLNRMDMSLPFVYYENLGDTSEAYLCVRDDSIEIKRFTYGGISGNTIKIKEAYRIDED